MSLCSLSPRVSVFSNLRLLESSSSCFSVASRVSIFFAHVHFVQVAGLCVLPSRMGPKKTTATRFSRRSAKSGKQVQRCIDLSGTDTFFTKWFDDDEDLIKEYSDGHAGRPLVTPKVVNLNWFEDEGFGFPKWLRDQNLKKFIELEGNFYHEVIKVFCYLSKLNNGIVEATIKGRLIRLDAETLSRVVGLSGTGTTKLSELNIPEFSETQVYVDSLRDASNANREKYLTGYIKKDDRILAFIIAWILTPRQHNYAQLTKDDLILIYAIKHEMYIDWVYLINDHFMKAKKKPNAPLPYAILLSKIFQDSGVDLEHEAIESLFYPNYIKRSFIRHMGLAKRKSEWMFKDEIPSNDDTDEEAASDDVVVLKDLKKRKYEAGPSSVADPNAIMEKLNLIHGRLEKFEERINDLSVQVDDLTYGVLQIRTQLGLDPDD